LDALELDSYGTSTVTPDFLPGNIGGELRKAYSGYSWQGSDHYVCELVVTGLRGCGSSRGNIEVKTMIQWLAASLARTKIYFICAGQAQAAFAADLKAFIEIGLRDE